ncbi:hypothetical protein KFL_005160060 [Klebsormidium nitens]|uniref:SAM domain-containing protein n=1 Tax=Klebsormidium nitens TaxID=105231 RepID=A0A1Y1IEL4_KLENI|nr:hypothetical protein KFL_005160060 [Klebsormidium nitens]|eukprot:GAQ89385.1 hypothetical protein KFL_005160060 [Klebsormidium nitens]
MATASTALGRRPARLDGQVLVHASTYGNVGTSSRQKVVPLRNVTRAGSFSRVLLHNNFLSQKHSEAGSNAKKRTSRKLCPAQYLGIRAAASATHEGNAGDDRKTLFSFQGFSSEGGHDKAGMQHARGSADDQTQAWDVLGNGKKQNAGRRTSADVASGSADVSKDQPAQQRERMQKKGDEEGWGEREAAWQRMKVPRLTAVGTPYPSTWMRLFQIVRSQPKRLFHIVRVHPEEREGGKTERTGGDGDAQRRDGDQRNKGKGDDSRKEGRGDGEKQGRRVALKERGNEQDPWAGDERKEKQGIGDGRIEIRGEQKEEKGHEQHKKRDEQEGGIGDGREIRGDEQRGVEPDEEAKKAVHVAGLEKDRQEERVEKRVRARKAEKKAKEEETLSPHSHPVSDWSTQEVVTWAADQGFLTTKVDVHRFLKAKIAGADLPYWTSEDFEEIGLPKGPAKRLVRAINELAVRRTIRVQFPFDCVPAGEEEADVTDEEKSDASPDAILTAEVTVRDDDELTEFLGEMCALGLVRIRDESATSAAEESATSAGEQGEHDAPSASAGAVRLARSIWDLENGGLYWPFYAD